MELPFDDWLAGNGSSPWSITFPQYMRLSQEQPRKSPKTKPLKTAIRVTKLARRYEVSIALSSFYMTSSQLTLWFSFDTEHLVNTQPRQSEPNSRAPKLPPPKEEEESEGEDGEPQEGHESALCGACSQSYDDFWTCCDLCEKCFHGKCMKITPAKAEHIRQYKCPSCTGSKTARGPRLESRKPEWPTMLDRNN